MHRALVFVASAVGAIYVLWLGGQLPETVASHFGPSGKADSFMPRAVFVPLMCLLTAGVPLLSWWMQTRAISRGKAKIPNASHWFAESRRAQTERFLLGHAALFSVVLTAFLCYVYWLVFAANVASPGPAVLGTTPFLVGTGAFLVVLAGWAAALQLRFRRGA